MASTVHYPVEVDATLDAPLSRWRWLFKWLFAIPHFVILTFLWLAFIVLSVVAFVAILFTGRYPRSIFDFNVGVLRWTWRVQYYAYGALGTDRYPPFTLAERADYPAHLEISYPDHLSRRLVLVKWWLLALPHYLIAGFFVGGGSWLAWRAGQDSAVWGGGGLIGLLVCFAGVALLFTGRYPRPIYDFVLGMNRWVLRVAAYASLMTDRYPPFRLDMGGHEPGGTLTLPGVSPPPEPAPSSASEPPLPVSAPPASPSPRTATNNWSAGRVLSIVVGAVFGLVAMGVVIAGISLLVVDHVNRDDSGYLRLGTRTYATSGYAITSQQFRLDSSSTGSSWLDHLIGRVRVSVTSNDPDKDVFVGVARTGAAREYLRGVDRLVVGNLDVAGLHATQLAGGPPAFAPTQANIWVASASGNGTRAVSWKPQHESWTILAMNADGSRTVAVRAEASAAAPGLHRFAYSVLGLGIALLIGSVLLIALPLRRAHPRETGPLSSPDSI
jgi:Domain of unknown function (DUF4389)